MITETEHLAGNTLRLTITLPDSVVNYNSVFISLYTNQNKQFRFSVAAKNDYYLAYVGDAPNKIKVVLTGAMTEKMSGKLMFEVKTINNIDDEVPLDEHGGQKYTGIIIKDFQLKSER